MINENAALRYRAILVSSILNLKNEAIRLGFDYPVEDDDKLIDYDLEALLEFQWELGDYINEYIALERNLLLKEIDNEEYKNWRNTWHKDGGGYPLKDNK